MAIATEELIETIHCVGAALEKSEEARVNEAALREKVAAAVPEAHRALMGSGLLEMHESDDLRRVLGDHGQTLRLLAKVAHAYHEAQSEKSAAASLGRPVSSEANGDGRSYYAGQRTGQLRESDLAYYRALGIDTRQ